MKPMKARVPPVIFRFQAIDALESLRAAQRIKSEVNAEPGPEAPKETG